MKTLIIVDVQNDFLPSGALAVEQGDQIIDVINRILPQYDFVVATQDWHPAGHASFASSYPGKNIYETIDLNGSPQQLWPDHCVQGSEGAMLSKNLLSHYIHEVIRKGENPTVDSYSGFYDNDKTHSTGLTELLREKSIKSVDIVGLATDYCVKFTALDALAEGFQVRVINTACRGVDLNPGDVKKALAKIQQAGGVIGEEEVPETIELWRPTGKNELAKVEASGWTKWPPRLPDQPIFYPVTNEKYACEIAERWNTKDKMGGSVGYVTRFSVKGSFLKNYPVRCVGSSYHLEYWIPAADLELLNHHIIGTIKVLKEYTSSGEKLYH